MKKTIIIISLLILLLAIFLFSSRVLTGFAINNNLKTSDYYIHTKAICNSTNFCQDYEITCNGTEVLDKKPITGAVIQHQEDWKDPRDNKELC